MSKLTHHLAAKVTAIFLFVITVIGFISGTVGACFLVEYDFYEASGEKAREAIFKNVTLGYANQVFYNYLPAHQNNLYDLSEQQRAFSPDNTNFLFVLKNAAGDIILSNYSDQEYPFSRTYKYYQKGDTYTMDCFVKEKLTAQDNYSTAEYWTNYAWSMRYAIIVIAAISLLTAILLFIFLMCSAGHRKGRDGITPNGIDKIPFDFFLATLTTVAFIEFALLDGIDHKNSTIVFVLFLAVFAVLDILLTLLLFMSFATRYKLGGWWKNTIVYHVLKFISKVIYNVCHGIKYLFAHLHLLWKVIIGMIGLSILELIVFAALLYEPDILLTMWMFEKIILFTAILFIVISLRKLQVGGQKIAAGDLNYHIDTKHMFWDFKRHAENMNSISGGMSKALDGRMKSERFKTELITNVSHDIKTPLTSIINYVDLIKKEDIEDERLKEYVDVLGRQSARLKKLIEDLVDASKASTGNLPVNMDRTEIGVLLTQTAGEYEGRLESSGLELILKQPEDEVFIMADGRLLWRVFDNLMNNICKYSQSSTRAYLNLEKINGQAVITFRNISKCALNITSDELLERFVRGDSSRNTEGSGLGLSIARSLVELQDGQLELYIDGDLFKVVLQFNAIH